QGQVFVAALQFDLSRLPRGAPIHAVLLRLTGLRADRFDPAAGGNWNLSILSPTAIASLPRTDFQALFNAPPALTLVPSLVADDLQPHQANTWQLDASALAWLEQQLLDGVTTLTLRIIGPTGGADTLFAWDSGSGPATGGDAPTLLLSLGPPPATPPAFPTQALVIATLTPTPENVLTVAANLLTATAVATTTGTYTPTPANIATPTPIPANFATAQAIALQTGLPPVVVPTPTPANAATATAQSLYATAVALTTGTFTPVPTNAITPRLITPTPPPENAATAVIVIATATAEALARGTPTPLPYDVFVATVTPRPLLIVATPKPENKATATIIAAQVTIIAMTTGTFTPIPTYAVTPTPLPQPTRVPLLLYKLPTPTPQPVPTPLPDRLPASLRGKILFISDRPMPDVGESTGVWAIDPDTGVLAYLTQGWVYSLAQSLELSSTQPEGVYKISVEPDNQRILQVWVYDPQYQVKTNVSQLPGMNYDPAWAPDGFHLVFVSQAPGNDEIYVVDRGGGQRQRLTFNDWEWDKHPSWSPDGSRIVFHSNREVGRTQLWVMSADGSNQVRLLSSPYSDYAPIWIK
ncbi:MAG: hypothetical protein GXP38_11345, partial [Chloroflexi bacterium]|nr:hypothetical protein [Chloroflexota bacterium]